MLEGRALSQGDRSGPEPPPEIDQRDHEQKRRCVQEQAIALSRRLGGRVPVGEEHAGLFERRSRRNGEQRLQGVVDPRNDILEEASSMRYERLSAGLVGPLDEEDLLRELGQAILHGLLGLRRGIERELQNCRRQRPYRLCSRGFRSTKSDSCSRDRRKTASCAGARCRS